MNTYEVILGSHNFMVQADYIQATQYNIYFHSEEGKILHMVPQGAIVINIYPEGEYDGNR